MDISIISFFFLLRTFLNRYIFTYLLVFLWEFPQLKTVSQIVKRKKEQEYVQFIISPTVSENTHFPTPLLTQASSVFANHTGREWHLFSCVFICFPFKHMHFYSSISCRFKSFLIFQLLAIFLINLYECFTF